MLFKLSNTVLEYAELTTITFAGVAPTIRLVEQQHILPALGATLYNALNTAYTDAADEASLSDEENNLLEYCRRAIGPLLCYYYAPKAAVKVGGAGTQRQESDTNKTAYQNQVREYREQMLREGEQAIEQLLQFLDENKIDYPDWDYADYKSLFIKSGSEFNEFFTSHSPQRNYAAMRGKMADVEENSIRPLLGDTLFDHLKTIDENDAGQFSAVEEKLVYKMKKIIAFLTVSVSVPFLNIRMDANGITVMNSTSAQSDQQAKRTAASDAELNSLISSCRNGAQSWINNLKKYLDDNKDAFADYLPADPAPEADCTNQPKVSGNQPDCSGAFGLI